MAGGRDEMQCAHECMTLGRMLTFPTVRTCRDVTPPSFAPLLTALLGVLLLVPLVPATRTADADEVSAAERRHDRINTVLLTPLCVALVGSWLCAVDAYTVALALCAYVLWDGAYLLTHATAVRTRRIILTHHVVTLIFALVPLHHHDLAEFTAIAGVRARSRAPRHAAAPSPAACHGRRQRARAHVPARAQAALSCRPSRLWCDGSCARTRASLRRCCGRSRSRTTSASSASVSSSTRCCSWACAQSCMCALAPAHAPACVTSEPDMLGACANPRPQAPRLESIVVIGCQGLLCTFNVVLWLRERRRADSSR